ncbi:MAG: phosphate ABC transporter substrate-binding protein PstS [Nocardioides sp.]|uniref:phosphate ABC transporter substrate-binding protein PstS n=1 Tax=Nocardioides sp. TaxID=35761 RepID=UPI003EFD8235
MKTTSIRKAFVPGVAVLAIALSACGAANETDGGSGDGGADGLSGTLNGAGASSQEAAQGAWRAAFQTANSDVTVNYDPVGSGGGREQFIAGGTAFAGSDSYLKDDEGELSAATETCGAEPIQVPAYVSPIAVIYNLDGVEDLNLAPATIAGIFDGSITKWNDPKIAADNEGVTLPDETINPVHRADGSGTTENFTEYLAAAGGWKHEPADEWPIEGGEAATGTSGVVAAVTDNPNTIGYADASQAGELGKVNVKVGDDFVAPDAEAAAKIIGASPRVDEASEVNFTVDIDHKTTEAGTYPIVLASYLIACQSYDDAATADLVKGYLTYVLSDEGQKASAESAGSAPLSADVASAATAAVEKISAN